MNYQRLTIGLRKYGRDTGFAYVHDGYKPQVRNTAKFKQWRRLLNRAELKAMTPRERDVLNSLLTIKAVSLMSPGRQEQVISSLS